MWGSHRSRFWDPCYFFLYINDIASISDKIFLLLFADDSNAFVSGKNLDETIDTMNMELNELVTWLNVIPEHRKSTLYVIHKQQKAKYLQNSKNQ